MMKKSSKVKTSLVLVILLFSIFMIIIPTTSAEETTADQTQQGGLISFAHVVNVLWTNSQNATLAIKPFEESRSYDLTITHSLARGPFGGSLYQVFYAGRTLDMKIRINGYPNEWSTVTAFTDTIKLTLPTGDPTQIKQYSYQLLISVDDEAPAFRRGEIRLGIFIEKFGIIQEYDQEITLEINPDYAPKLNVIAEMQHKVIGPMDTASIPIKVTNLGNGESKIYFDVPTIPKDWTVLVTDQITLAPDQTETVFLTAKPPKSFGYHDDTFTFKVEYYPAWSTNPKITGTTEQITVSIESRGISLIGGEIILPILILIIIIIWFIYYYFKKYKSK